MCEACILEHLYHDFYKRNFCAFQCKRSWVAQPARMTELLQQAKREYNMKYFEYALQDSVDWTTGIAPVSVKKLRQLAAGKRIDVQTRVRKTFQVKDKGESKQRAENYFGTVLGFTDAGHLLVEWEPASCVQYPDANGRMRTNRFGVIHVKETVRPVNQKAAPAQVDIPDDVLELAELEESGW
mmetsp:Transcript_14827/g.29744  ORF Transcript_14827/g.29744 Transcript_14827/m.29744 type:complete len:183 (-) Transcript_14827:42-590(-)